ncbi:hypothetical protein LZC95_28765 [Pendulispora brunnea]|uniref:Uncharacterized protein n=1 Tax=Pendulispora brunnea TaxID=2905690 RepID=A0ABZ2K276_9BACT
MIGLGKVSLIGLGVIAGVASVVSFGSGHPAAGSREQGRPTQVENHVAPVLGVHVASAASPSVAAEPTAVATADTDMRQLRAGFMFTDQGAKFAVNGPFVLTDLSMGSSPPFVSVYVVPAGTDCSGPIFDYRILEAQGEVHGARIPIPSGSSACIQGNFAVSWSGFVPY